MTPVTVIVMAKAPRAGLAKTRLIPALGAEGAAALARRMLQHTLLQALSARLGPVLLCGTPRGDDPDLGLPADHGLQLADQGEGDLGARMARAFAGAAVNASQPAPLLMIGTDAPALDAALLRQAAAALATHDAVFVPALDGGYALIGLQLAAGAPLPPIFDAMPWSTPQLMSVTRARLAAAGLRHAELPALADIDEPADLVHLPPGWLP